MRIILKILTVTGLFIFMVSSFTLLALAESSIVEDVSWGNDIVSQAPLLATFSITSTADAHDSDLSDGQCYNTSEGACTLRAAIEQANYSAGEDTIMVSAGIYTLTLGQLDITSTMTIQRSGVDSVTIDGNANGRVFEIDSSAVVTISDVTITNGGNEDLGGGILNQGTLVLSDTIVTGNTANWDGGGIYNQKTLTIISSTISYNLANGAGSADDGVGGGIANSAQGADATLTVSQSSIINNTANGVGGGGISNSAASDVTATVTVNDSIISGNNANGTDYTTGFGGGIRNGVFGGTDNNFSILTVNRSTVSGNSAVNGGGIGNGTLTTGNLNLKVTLDSSTVSDNTAAGSGSLVGNGGGIVNQSGTMMLVNSTVSGNAANGTGASTSGLGGGVANNSSYITTTLWLTNTTLADNTAISGTGVANVKGVAAATTNFKNSIIAGGCYNQSGTFTSLGYNLEDSDTCNLTATGDIINTNPSLGLLADNGGNTETHALLSGSKAIDTGSCVLLTDQRGVDRPNPTSQTPFCDIGAYESDDPGVVDLQITKTVTPSEVEPGETITYTLTFANNGPAGVTGVVITDEVPITLTNVMSTSSGATIVSTPGFTYSWTVQDLLAGEGGVITITGEIVSPTVDGTFFNTAIITTTINNPDEPLSSNSDSVPVTVNTGSSGPGGGGIFLPIVLKNS